MSLSSLKVWECLLSILEILSKDPCHPKSRMITPLRTNMKPENHPIETETHLESEPENLHFCLHFCGFPSWNHHPFLSPTESPKATSLKPPLVVRHKLLKKRVGSGCKSQNSNPEKHGWQCHNVCTPDITRLHDVSVLLLYVKWLRLKLPASYGYNIAQCLSIAARLGSFRLFKAL